MAVVAFVVMVFVLVSSVAVFQVASVSGSSGLTFETAASLFFAMLLFGFAAGAAVVLRLGPRREEL